MTNVETAADVGQAVGVADVVASFVFDGLDYAWAYQVQFGAECDCAAGVGENGCDEAEEEGDGEDGEAHACGWQLGSLAGLGGQGK